ncbi:methionine ABC transporter ATP-binding protein [Ruania halotolerans]|uniref:methionine ABC transporter ATP-binding protein n=1 Tax=Ruania halotolerans TaxID=2897773 RepID=UPI001E52AA1E|nr:ATP-binding cassette domain-containing protein [Ruania halotolerans]UFU05533.1 ATP-binding cassette domain-containing protein [Ruania halotolerans]
MSEPIIALREASKVFTARSGDVHAVDGVTFDITEGEIFGVIGYSGAGKSTLVRLINALEPATSGSVVVDGVDLTTLAESRLRQVRAGIGMIFQQFNLLGSRTVAKNVSYPLEVAGWPKAERAARVAELLEFVGISDKAHVYPAKLSGGQKQRVGIARALATNPRILLADECTSALDPETTQDVLALLRRVNTELGITVVVITHEMDVVRSLCDRVAVMEHGRVVELDDTYRVFSAPQHVVSRRFVASALKDRPAADVLERLRARHPGRLVTVGVDDAGHSTATMNQVLREVGVDSTVVFGGITEVAQRPYGSLTLELTGERARIQRGVTALRGFSDVVDLGTASDPHEDPSIAPPQGSSDGGTPDEPPAMPRPRTRRPGSGLFGGGSPYFPIGDGRSS